MNQQEVHKRTATEKADAQHAKAEDAAAFREQTNKATTAAAQRISALIDDIDRTGDEGLTGPQVDNVLGRLEVLKAWLTGYAADPAAPIPAVAGPPAMPGPFHP